MWLPHRPQGRGGMCAAKEADLMAVYAQAMTWEAFFIKWGPGA